MKTLYTALISVLLVTSCQISQSSDFQISSMGLLQHAKNRFFTYVTTPVEVTELMIAFDQYLARPEAEKESETMFYGRVSMIYDNIYMIKNYDEMGLCCIVDTKGRSLKETPWEFASISAWLERGNKEYPDWLMVTEFTLPESTFLALDDEQEYVMSYEGVFETRMKFLGKDGDRDMWEVSVSGQTAKEGNLYTVFGSSEAPLKVKERVWDSEDYPGNSYEGEFYVDFMRDGQRLDYCNMTFRHAFTPKYVTSRD